MAVTVLKTIASDKQCEVVFDNAQAEEVISMDEATAKKELGVTRWSFDADWVQSLENLISRPTVNIEGLVGGYTGPGGKTVLPHKAVAKLDLRLVPDMKASEALAARA